MVIALLGRERARREERERLLEVAEAERAVQLLAFERPAGQRVERGGDLLVGQRPGSGHGLLSGMRPATNSARSRPSVRGTSRAARPVREKRGPAGVAAIVPASTSTGKRGSRSSVAGTGSAFT